MTEKRITEAELVLPTLYLMEQNGGSITTSVQMLNFYPTEEILISHKR